MTDASGDLAVIVPHYDDPARLRTCLAALAPQLTARPGTDCVVVDNDSQTELAALVAEFPGIRWITESEKGAAAARNRGVAETRAPWIAFLDCDCVPASDWLASAARLAGSADVIGGRIDTFDETPPPRSGAQAFEAVVAVHQRTYIQRKGFSVTANLVTSRAVFTDVGPLIVGLSEDMDWCFRATAKGYSLVYADDLRVSHPTRADWQALVKKWRRTTDEMYHLNGTGVQARALWALRAGAVIGSAPVHLPRLMRDRRLAGTERLRGAATLLRLRALRALWMLRQAATGR